MSKVLEVYQLVMSPTAMVLSLEGPNLTGDYQTKFLRYQELVNELNRLFIEKYSEGPAEETFQTELDPEHELIAREISQLQQDLSGPLIELITIRS